MELIEVINSSLIIFFSIVSITAAFSYITYKVKDRTKGKEEKNITVQVENTPVSGVYPRMLVVSDSYKLPGEIKESIRDRRLYLFGYDSLNIKEKMNELSLTK